MKKETFMKALRHLRQVTDMNFSGLPKAINPYNNIVQLYGFVLGSILEGYFFLRVSGNTIRATKQPSDSIISETMVPGAVEVVQLALEHDRVFRSLFKSAPALAKGLISLEVDLPDGISIADVALLFA